ncbi:MAG: alkaline phosphatase PhoX [Bacteroidota bacterium]
MDRRSFLKQGAVVTMGFTGLWQFCQFPSPSRSTLPTTLGYGPLVKDPKGYLDLPKGFSYKIISKAGNPMSDSLLVPGLADGMATFKGKKGRVVLIRNHENSPNPAKNGAFAEDYRLLNKVDAAKFYDYGKGDKPGLGGTTTVIYNEKTQQVELEYLSLAGTYRNCAGGPTPWNSWITCEEDVTPKGDYSEKDHGYNFEVPVSEKIKLFDPIPLKAMGRFNHEAVCVDPKTGIVYQTEDRHDGLIYRFIPNQKGKLAEGGKLQAMVLMDQRSFDSRNWEETTLKMGETLAVSWMDMEDVEAPEDDLRTRGFDQGAIRFARGEGIWFGEGEMYFACTNGGKKKFGQVFRYQPSPYEGSSREKEAPGKLSLFVESDDKEILKHCDNLTIAPWGDIFLCEDDRDAYLRGVSSEGKIFTFGHNVGSQSEFAGATFSPSGETLFVNIQGPGHTLAITGPWDQRK